MAEVTKKYINEDLSKLCQFFDEVMDKGKPSLAFILTKYVADI